MSGVYILRNVYNFAQILNQASSDDLRKWDEASLQKAIRWAKYCEEVHTHVRQQGCDEAMNAKLLQLTVLLSPASLLRLNFDCLMTATDILTKIILANPHGTPELRQSLQILIEKTVWTKANKKIKEMPNLNEDLDDIFTICWIQNEHAWKTLKESSISTYSQVLLTNLLKIMETTESKQRFQCYCQSICDRLVSAKRGWELLVHIFLIAVENSSCGFQARKEEMLKIILLWMDLKAQKAEKCPILDVDKAYLQLASFSNQGFFTFYLSTLEKWSECFQPFIGGPHKEVWRDHEGNGASTIADHFRPLLTSSRCDTESDIKTPVLTVISSNVRSSDFTVWRTVANILLTS